MKLKSIVNMNSTNKPKMKIRIIMYLISWLNKECNFPICFDNTIPNKYKLKTLKGEYVFGTYSDVLNALRLVVENKESEVSD
jgi:hypothetical protein